MNKESYIKMDRYNFRTIVFCPRCLYDIEEDFGYLEWKHYKFCPECGTSLIDVPLENRPSEMRKWIESQKWRLVLWNDKSAENVEL